MPGSSSERRRRAGPGVRVDDREVDLAVVGAEVHEQLVDLVEDLRGAGVGSVDLVDRDDDRQVAGHRLLEDVAGLGQRALRGVDEEQHGVDHQQAPLDLAAEVGVARRVDDVQADAAVVDGRLLGEDRDALLALEVHRVEDAVDDGLVRPERAGLAEHRVDERGLAVVDVGDDGDVAEVGSDGASGGGGHGRGSPRDSASGRGILARIGRHGPDDAAYRREAQDLVGVVPGAEARPARSGSRRPGSRERQPAKPAAPDLLAEVAPGRPAEDVEEAILAEPGLAADLDPLVRPVRVRDDDAHSRVALDVADLALVGRGCPDVEPAVAPLEPDRREQDRVVGPARGEDGDERLVQQVGDVVCGEVRCACVRSVAGHHNVGTTDRRARSIG